MKNRKMLNILIPPVLVLLTIIPTEIVYVLSKSQNYLFKVFLYVTFFVIVIVLAGLVSIFYNKRNGKRINENFNNEK